MLVSFPYPLILTDIGLITCETGHSLSCLYICKRGKGLRILPIQNMREQEECLTYLEK